MRVCVRGCGSVRGMCVYLYVVADNCEWAGVAGSSGRCGGCGKILALWVGYMCRMCARVVCVCVGVVGAYSCWGGEFGQVLR